MTTSRIDHSSPSRFSTGVPVSAMRCPAGSRRTALAAWVCGFFTAWASSSTTVVQATAASASTSRAADW